MLPRSRVSGRCPAHGNSIQSRGPPSARDGPSPIEKKFILYDGRAKTEGTDNASILTIEDSERMARRVGREDYHDVDCVWFEYDVQPTANKRYGKNVGELINEKRRDDIPAGNPEAK